MTTGARWPVKVVDATLTLLRSIWQARNDVINTSEDGPTINANYKAMGATILREPRNYATDRHRLFDLSLEDRLETAPKLQVFYSFKQFSL